MNISEFYYFFENKTRETNLCFYNTLNKELTNNWKNKKFNAIFFNLFIKLDFYIIFIMFMILLFWILIYFYMGESNKINFVNKKSVPKKYKKKTMSKKSKTIIFLKD